MVEIEGERKPEPGTTNAHEHKVSYDYTPGTNPQRYHVARLDTKIRGHDEHEPEMTWAKVAMKRGRLTERKRKGEERPKIDTTDADGPRASYEHFAASTSGVRANPTVTGEANILLPAKPYQATLRHKSQIRGAPITVLLAELAFAASSCAK